MGILENIEACFKNAPDAWAIMAAMPLSISSRSLLEQHGRYHDKKRHLQLQNLQHPL
ncbi:hypothetical protein [Maribacter sp. 2307ULW6-5]|uniref:hypothetical protein n=1 Tax=Maribacter sp. 2307ULW6-5 TaxID=3386275 RepID=UPI0039BC9707